MNEVCKLTASRIVSQTISIPDLCAMGAISGKAMNAISKKSNKEARN